MESIRVPEIIRQGLLQKQGGGAGGHKNWKERYFVLTDHMYYYNNQAHFAKEPKNPIGRVALNAYFVTRAEDAASSFEFTVSAYPKSLVLRASSAEDMEEWVSSLMAPMEDLARVPEEVEEGAKGAAAGGGVSKGDAATAPGGEGAGTPPAGDSEGTAAAAAGGGGDSGEAAAAE